MVVSEWGRNVRGAGGRRVGVRHEGPLLHASGVRFIRVALTEEQVEDYGLPNAPAKASSHGKDWGARPTAQLEALAPDQLNQLIRHAVLYELDEAQLARDRADEQRERQELVGLLPAPRDSA